MEKKGLSIRYKLLLLLVSFPTLILGLYLTLAMRIFVSDKIAYVFDSSSTVSKSLSSQIRTQLSSFRDQTKIIINGYDDKKKILDKSSKSAFDDENELLYFAVFNKGSNNSFNKSLELRKSFTKTNFNFDRLSIDLLKEVQEDYLTVKTISLTKEIVFCGFRAKGTLGQDIYVVTIRKVSELLKSFTKGSFYSNFLVNAKGEILISSPQNEATSISSFSKWEFFQDVNKKNIPATTLETKEPKTQTKLLISLARVGIGNLFIISIVKKDAALRAAFILLWKSVLFFVALISLSTIVSLLASKKFTGALLELYRATLQVREGNYDINVQIKSSDEIGGLARSFNNMSGELKQVHEKLKDYARNLEIKVEERTKELATTNRMLDAMVNSLGQGFTIFDIEGKCLPIYSKACLSILETNPSNKYLWDVLKISEEKIADFKKWCGLLFQEPLPFEDLVEIGPKIFDHSEKKYIVLEFFPVRNELGKITGVVLVATEKTKEKEALDLAQKEKTQSKRIVRIAKNRSQFRSFVKATKEAFTYCKKIIDANDGEVSTPDTLMRILHGLKGDAGSFQMDFLVQKVHQTEGNIESLKSKNEFKSKIQQVKQYFDELETAFDLFLMENKEIIGDKGLEKTIDIPYADLLRFSYELTKNAKMKEISTSFENKFLKEPIEQFFLHFNDLSMDLANLKGKKINPISIKGGDLRIISPPYIETLSNFVHVFRNSVDHGIETPSNREEHGKTPEGTITLEFSKKKSQSSSIIEIIFSDDGGGIDSEIIRKKLVEKGIPVKANETDEEVVNHIFDIGFSTKQAADELSGRGVGLNALKVSVEKMGGTVKVKTKLGEGTSFIVSLPEVSQVIPEEKAA